MDLNELVDLLVSRPCDARMTRAPFWRCTRPHGHTGDHMRIAAVPFEVDVTDTAPQPIRA